MLHPNTVSVQKNKVALESSLSLRALASSIACPVKMDKGASEADIVGDENQLFSAIELPEYKSLGIKVATIEDESDGQSNVTQKAEGECPNPVGRGISGKSTADLSNSRRAHERSSFVSPTRVSNSRQQKLYRHQSLLLFGGERVRFNEETDALSGPESLVNDSAVSSNESLKQDAETALERAQATCGERDLPKLAADYGVREPNLSIVLSHWKNNGSELSEATLKNVPRWKRAPELSVMTTLQEDLLMSLDCSAEEVRVLLDQQKRWFRWPRLARKKLLLDIKTFRRTRKQLYSSLHQRSYVSRWLAQQGFRTDWDAFVGFCKYQVKDGAFHVFFMVLSLCVDICFSILYLAEMQIVYPRYNLGKGYPHWLFISRPMAIWYTAVSFATFDALSTFAYVMRWEGKIHQLLWDRFFLFNLLTAGPFIASIFFDKGNELYVPYYLRLWVVLLRLRGVLRLHKNHTRIVDDFTERTIILILTLINILFTAMCAFQYFEMMTPPKNQFPYRYGIIESFYFIIITASTVGYGDITPTSYPSQIIVILLIIVALAVLPGLISNLVEAAKTSGGSSTMPYYHDPMSEFVVIQGFFRTPEFVNDLLHVFFGTKNYRSEMRLLLLSSEKLDNSVRGLINSSAYDSRVQFRLGSLLEERDLKRYNISQASAIFLAGHEPSMPSAAASDQNKVLTVWSLNEYASSVPVFVETLLPQTDSYIAKYSRAVACLDELRQILLGYSCLYRGSSTLILNLLNQVMPTRNHSLAWEAQYADGLNQQIATGTLNPIFVDFHFNKLSKFLYEQFQVILFAVNVYNPQTYERTFLLNPGRSYRMDVNDICVYICPSAMEIDQINLLSLEQYKYLTSLGAQANLYFSRERRLSASIVSSARSSTSNDIDSPEVSTDSLNKFFTDISEETTIKPPTLGQLFNSDVPLCHVLKKPHHNRDECVISSAEKIAKHILILAQDFHLIRLVCTLRSAQLNSGDFRPVVIFSHRLPTAREFKSFAEFPKIYFIRGDCLSSKDLLRAGLRKAEKVLIMSLNRSASSDKADDAPLDDADAATLSLSDFRSLNSRSWGGDSNDDLQDGRTIIVCAMIHELFPSEFQSKTVIVEITRRSYVRFIAPTLTSSNAKSQKLAINSIKAKIFGVESLEVNNSVADPSRKDSLVSPAEGTTTGLGSSGLFTSAGDNMDSKSGWAKSHRLNDTSSSISTRTYLHAKRDIALYGLDKREQKFEYLFTPTYAAGRILLERPLKTILMDTFVNSVTLDAVKVLCGVRYKESLDVYHTLQISPSYLCYIDVLEGFENRPFGHLFAELASRYGIIALGLYRAANNPVLGNSLPFVYTNPLASTLVIENDLVYVLKFGND